MYIKLYYTQIILNRMDQDIEGVLGKKSLLTFKSS